jgi:hypothetical protein
MQAVPLSSPAKWERAAQTGVPPDQRGHRSLGLAVLGAAADGGESLAQSIPAVGFLAEKEFADHRKDSLPIGDAGLFHSYETTPEMELAAVQEAPGSDSDIGIADER